MKFLLEFDVPEEIKEDYKTMDQEEKKAITDNVSKELTKLLVVNVGREITGITLTYIPDVEEFVGEIDEL